MFRALHRKVSHEKPLYVREGPYHTFTTRDTMPLVPGEPAELAFDLLPISYLFRQGHAIRIAIAGADVDQIAPLSAEPPTIHVLRGGIAGTRVVLPVP
jgi:predicted acyl esterase